MRLGLGLWCYARCLPGNGRMLSFEALASCQPRPDLWRAASNSACHWTRISLARSAATSIEVVCSDFCRACMPSVARTSAGTATRMCHFSCRKVRCDCPSVTELRITRSWSRFPDNRLAPITKQPVKTGQRPDLMLRPPQAAYRHLHRASQMTSPAGRTLHLRRPCPALARRPATGDRPHRPP